MWEPTRLNYGEGRRWLEEVPETGRATDPAGPTGVVAMACMQEESTSNTGNPGGEGA